MYLLDANVFIDAKRNHYRFDPCPGFWEWLDHAHEMDVVASIEKVRSELVGTEDELSDWARASTGRFGPVAMPRHHHAGRPSPHRSPATTSPPDHGRPVGPIVASPPPSWVRSAVWSQPP